MSKANGLMTSSLAKKVRTRQLVEVRLKDLHSNPMNPPERTTTNNALLTLRNKVREYGVINPIHFCGQTMTLCDGHRRVSVARQCDVKKIHGYRYDGLTLKERDILFKILNTTSVKYSGAQELFTYLEGGEVSEQFASYCSTILRAGDHIKMGDGMKFLTTMRNNKKSPASYYIGINEYSKLTGDKSITTQAKVLNWMLNIGSAHGLKSLISLKCPKHLIQDAGENDRPIAGTWEISIS